MCALTQRFGRGARDPALSAVAVLFAESKYFDDHGSSSKKRKRSQLETAGASQNEMAIQDLPSNVCDEDRRQMYQSWEDTDRQRERKGRRTATEIEPALSDMVNAVQRDINCHRKPSHLFFDNDKIGEYTQEFLTPYRTSIDFLSVRSSPLSTIIERLFTLRSPSFVNNLLRAVYPPCFSGCCHTVNSQTYPTCKPVSSLKNLHQEHGPLA